MLNKLAFTGIKSRIKDYLVLFFGLVISSAIFYMFESLATNQAFIKANGSMVASAGFIFQLGSVLLILITLVYVFYANSFLMSMRRHDYGLFMMLGAKQKKIGELILTETLVIGALASVVGVFFGWFLTATLAKVLMDQMLGTQLKGFAAFYPPAMLWTIGLYLILFLIAGFINRRQLVKTPVLELLKGDGEPNRAVLKPAQQAFQGGLGVALLAVGYFAMTNVKLFNLASIPLALVTIFLGTYFLFNAVFVWLVVGLKRTEWAGKKLHNFTLSQLSFRIRNYTKMLAIVAILFALALGAITVGMGFNRQINTLSTSQSAYTMVISNPSKVVKREIGSLNRELTVTYDQKITNQAVYFNASQVKAQPFEKPSEATSIAAQAKAGHLQATKYVAISPKTLAQNRDQLLLDLPNDQREKKIHVVSAATFNRIEGRHQQLLMFRVASLKNSQKRLSQIAGQVKDREAQQIPGTYATYVMSTVLFGGFEFMGLFLGVAFLAMLASCLMFKILSGAASDRVRYRMLNKIGARQSTLKNAIRAEVGVLFALPGVVGIVHVLFGLKLFSGLLLSPYDQLQLPFAIFLVLYILYYVITVTMYDRIVIPNVKIDQ